MQWANAGLSTNAGAGRGHHALAIAGIALVLAPLTCVMLGGLGCVEGRLDAGESLPSQPILTEYWAISLYVCAGTQ
jgi:hypothetical protein